MNQSMTEARQRLADAAVAAENIERVLDVTVVAPDESQHDCWTLDLLVDQLGERLGVPPEVHELFGKYELASVESGPQGPDFQRVIAVA
jgi:hypothetical protein